MSDKNEITDLGEAIVAIIQSPPGTWVDRHGCQWMWQGEGHKSLQRYNDDNGYWEACNHGNLDLCLPIRRVRYGWVPCEREDAYELPDGSRVYMGKLWDPVESTPCVSRLAMVDPGCIWVKWGRL